MVHIQNIMEDTIRSSAAQTWKLLNSGLYENGSPHTPKMDEHFSHVFDVRFLFVCDPLFLGGLGW